MKGKNTEIVLVSACLVGLRTRYDGRSSADEKLRERLRDCTVVPACPEQLGGLPTPREPAEIDRGDGESVLEGTARVVTATGEDVTEHFVRGAHEMARLAEQLEIRKAFLKENSPSCGVTRIARKGKSEAGSGVCAALLRRNDISVVGV